MVYSFPRMAARAGALLCAFALSQTAWAQETPAPSPADAHPGPTPQEEATAKLRFQTGQQLYQAGKFKAAAEEFEEAHQLAQRPALLFNAYLARRDEGNNRKAAENLEGYLRGAPDVGDRRPQLEERLASLKRQIAEEDAQLAEKSRLEAEAEAAKEEAERQRKLREAQESSGPSTTSWILGGSGLAVLAGGFVFGALANGAANDIVDNCPSNRCHQDFDLAGKRDTAQGMALIADIAFVAGAGLIGASLVLMFVGGDDSADVSFTPMCGPQGCQLSMQGTF